MKFGVFCSLSLVFNVNTLIASTRPSSVRLQARDTDTPTNSLESNPNDENTLTKEDLLNKYSYTIHPDPFLETLNADVKVSTTEKFVQDVNIDELPCEVLENVLIRFKDYLSNPDVDSLFKLGVVNGLLNTKEFVLKKGRLELFLRSCNFQEDHIKICTAFVWTKTLLLRGEFPFTAAEVEIKMNELGDNLILRWMGTSNFFNHMVSLIIYSVYYGNEETKSTMHAI